MKTPYFKKTTGRINGYPAIEYGYCNIDENSRAKDIDIIGKYDVVSSQIPFFLHIDVTKDGYFRILSENVEWGKYTATIVLSNKGQGE